MSGVVPSKLHNGAMFWENENVRLLAGKQIPTVCLAVLTRCRSVTDRETETKCTVLHADTWWIHQNLVQNTSTGQRKYETVPQKYTSGMSAHRHTGIIVSATSPTSISHIVGSSQPRSQSLHNSSCQACFSSKLADSVLQWNCNVVAETVSVISRHTTNLGFSNKQILGIHCQTGRKFAARTSVSTHTACIPLQCIFWNLVYMAPYHYLPVCLARENKLAKTDSIVHLHCESKKLGHFYFYCNFGKCWSIFKILSMSESERNGS